MSALAQAKPLIGHSREYTPPKIVTIDYSKVGIKGQVDLYTFEERITCLKNYGDHCMSFSMLPPGMNLINDLEC
jgi:hypothetical protein